MFNCHNERGHFLHHRLYAVCAFLCNCDRSVPSCPLALFPQLKTLPLPLRARVISEILTFLKASILFGRLTPFLNFIADLTVVPPTTSALFYSVSQVIY